MDAILEGKMTFAQRRIAIRYKELRAGSPVDPEADADLLDALTTGEGGNLPDYLQQAEDEFMLGLVRRIFGAEKEVPEELPV